MVAGGSGLVVAVKTGERIVASICIDVGIGEEDGGGVAASKVMEGGRSSK